MRFHLAAVTFHGALRLRRKVDLRDLESGETSKLAIQSPNQDEQKKV